MTSACGGPAASAATFTALSAGAGADAVGGGAFGGDALLFGRSRLVLRHLLGLFSRDARLLGGFGFRFGLCLLRLLGALGGEPCPLLFGQPRLLGRSDARFFGGDLVELKLGKARVEAIGILREEGVERALVADLQREFVIAAGFGLRADGGRRRGRAAGAGRAGTSGTSSPPSEPYTKGSCLLPVVLSTSSRTKPNARRTSSPGFVRWCDSADVNGLFWPSPSAAVEPALAE